MNTVLKLIAALATALPDLLKTWAAFLGENARAMQQKQWAKANAYNRLRKAIIARRKSSENMAKVSAAARVDDASDSADIMPNDGYRRD